MSGYWGDFGPTKEHLLREEYPDLEEKWEVYHGLRRDFYETDKELKKFGIIKRLFNSKEYNRGRSNLMKAQTLYENALKDYLILEKLLWDY